MKTEQVGYWVVGFMLVAQGIAVRLLAPFWIIALPVTAVAILAVIHTLNHDGAKVTKPLRAYTSVAVLAAATGAAFWFAPEKISFKLQMARVAFLDVSIIWFAAVASSHARGNIKSA